MTAHVYPFPTPAKLVEHPQANAYGFKPVEPVEDPRERVEVTAGRSKIYAVRVDGVIRNEFDTATNAIRCAEHVRGLLTLGALEALPPFHGAA